MAYSKSQIAKWFQDEFFAEDIEEMLQNESTSIIIKDTIAKIVSGTEVREILGELYKLSKEASFVVDIPLSDSFFLLSEASTTSTEERDFAIDMSIYLSEDEDSRDSNFNPQESYSALKK